MVLFSCVLVSVQNILIRPLKIVSFIKTSVVVFTYSKRIKKKILVLLGHELRQFLLDYVTNYLFYNQVYTNHGYPQSKLTKLGTELQECNNNLAAVKEQNSGCHSHLIDGV